MYLSLKLNIIKFSLFIILIIISIHIPTCFSQSQSQTNDQYSACAHLFHCANIQSIGYPFWGENRPHYCGHPSFHLSNCQSDAPLLQISDQSYRVLAIHNPTHTLTVSRQDYSNNICPRFLHNTTLDSTFFSYVYGNQDLTLHYGCTPISFRIQQNLPNQFNCIVNGTNSTVYYTIGPGPISISTSTATASTTVSTSNSSSSSKNTTTTTTTASSTTITLACKNIVVVPVNQSSAEALRRAGASTGDVRESLGGGFGLQWAANDTNCNRCEVSGGRCGYNSSSASFACYCADQPYLLTCNNTQTGSTSRPPFGPPLIIGLSVSVVVIIILSIVIIYYCIERRCLLLKCVIFWKKETLDDQKIEEILKKIGDLAPKRYSCRDIEKMTNSFRDKLGQGGFSRVYKGKLSDGSLVAVKILSDTKGDGEDFINEVASISKTSHVNVVTLVGFCYSKDIRALIFDFMPNGSLDKFINSLNINSRLPLKTLYNIALGTARGLEYLHKGCNPRIVHLDIKPQNILLDADLCPKISDFGLAKLCKRKESNVSMTFARGTIGYIAPEVYNRALAHVSHKSDVYSYGMMVLEIAGARGQNVIEVGDARSSEAFFPDWIYEHLEHDEKLRVIYGVASEEEDEIVRKMILVSLWCIQFNPLERPSMSEVVEMLQGGLERLELPPKPQFFAPGIRAQKSSSPLSQSTEKLLETNQDHRTISIAL